MADIAKAIRRLLGGASALRGRAAAAGADSSSSAPRRHRGGGHERGEPLAPATVTLWVGFTQRELK